MEPTPMKTRIPPPPNPDLKQEPTMDDDTTCQWDVLLMSDGTYRFVNVRPLNPEKRSES